MICGQWSAGASSDDSKEQNMDKEHCKTQTLCPYIPWHNSLLERNPTAELGIEPGIFFISTQIRSYRAKRPDLIKFTR